MIIIDGKKIADEIIENLKSQPKPKKILAAVLVGNNPESENFLKQKEKIAKELGVDFRVYKFSEELKNDDLRREIGKIAKLSRVGGIIVQLPLPEQINRRYVLSAIPIEKDVDALGEKAQKFFQAGEDRILPPAVGVVEEILKSFNPNLKSSKVAIVGIGFLVGKPISEWLKGKCAELYLLDIDSDLSSPVSELKNADLVISGVGKPGLINPDLLKDDTGVINFGYEIKDGKIFGDFNDRIGDLGKLSFYTPTPGGTGPILVAKLFENFYKLNS